MKQFPVDLARILLLPREQASVTEHGIVFRGHLYDSEHAKNTGMLASARMTGRENTEVMHDRNLINSIYMQLDHGSYAECTLSKQERADKNSSWY